MNDNVINLGEKTNNALHSSPESVLDDGLQRVMGGTWKDRSKVVVIALDDKDGDYNASWIQCGMKTSELLALFSIVQAMCLEEMGYIPPLD